MNTEQKECAMFYLIDKRNHEKVVSSTKRTELEHLMEHLASAELFSIEEAKQQWTVKDVQSVRPDLNTEQAESVLQWLKDHQQDEGEGVTRSLIRYWAQQLLPR